MTLPPCARTLVLINETLKHYDLFVTLVNSKLKKITLDTILNWHKEIFGQTKVGRGIRQH